MDSDLPTILITNDDGYFSPSLHALVEEAKKHYKVYVVVPDSNCSGIGRAVSLEMPIKVREIEPDFYAISGTPVDCVCFALGHVMKEKPLFIVSGINNACNLGTDVFCSGTVSAAMEGYMRGIPSIAVSQEQKGNYKRAARLALRCGESVMHKGPILLNVNTPHDDFQHIIWTRLWLQQRKYDYSVDAKRDPRGKDYFWIGGGEIKTLSMPFQRQKTDCQAFLEGMASITPLHLDLTNYRQLESTQFTVHPDECD